MTYSYHQQTIDYRREAWAAGCTCPMLPPHIHLVECPQHETPEQMAERLEEEHGE